MLTLKTNAWKVLVGRSQLILCQRMKIIRCTFTNKNCYFAAKVADQHLHQSWESSLLPLADLRVVSPCFYLTHLCHLQVHLLTPATTSMRRHTEQWTVLVPNDRKIPINVTTFQSIFRGAQCYLHFKVEKNEISLVLFHISTMDVLFIKSLKCAVDTFSVPGSIRSVCSDYKHR